MNTTTASAPELATALLDALKITPENWHRLKNNRRARAQEQVAAALVYLLKGDDAEALAYLQQAVGWLDRSVSAPPCPSHAPKKQQEGGADNP